MTAQVIPLIKDPVWFARILARTHGRKLERWQEKLLRQMAREQSCMSLDIQTGNR